ncbi:MAG: hypothetical protein ACYS1C_07885 [Planctomycetota bacterium]|jgi:hypothetical protein
MCKKQARKCRRKENPEARPQECSTEQVRECHGDGAEHPCEGAAEDED